MADLGTARKTIADKAALQGNLDPAVLLTDPAVIEQETKKILAAFGEGPGHIANLGHGITPDVPVENARAFVQAIKEFSPKYHSSRPKKHRTDTARESLE